VNSDLVRVPGAHLHLDFVASPRPSDRPPLLLLHGGPGADSGYLRPQLDHLATLGAGRQLVYYDQRGAERSPLDEGTAPAGYAVHVEDVEAVRRYLGVEQLSLCGYSWGGLLAMLYATRYPERIARLVLIAPAPAHYAMRQELTARMAAAPSRPEIVALRNELQSQFAHADPATVRNWRFALAVAGYFVNPRRALELTPFRVQQRLETAIWRSLGEYDLRPELPKLRGVPVLVVHGIKDVIPIESAEDTAALLGARLVRLDACGHVPYIEAAPQFFAAVDQFLADTAG
jgi:proline iminopeptidase